MNSVKICWLYDDLLDLYGDSGNLMILEKRLAQMGIPWETSRLSLADEPDFLAYDMIYIGPGKAKNLARAAEHFVQFKENALQAVEEGRVFLITGNARLLFGREFTGFDGKIRPGAGLFPYTGKETGSVFISDVVGTWAFAPDTPSYGFVNRTAHIEGNVEFPLCSVRLGAGDGEGPAEHEGNLYKNFFATWQLGPVLVKNPVLLREILVRLAGDRMADYDDSLEKKALELTLAEFPQA